MANAKVITIPKELVKKGDDLVVIPRSEYREYLDWKNTVRIYTPTAAEKKALRQARKDFARGNYLTLDEFKNELGGSHSYQSK